MTPMTQLINHSQDPIEPKQNLQSDLNESMFDPQDNESDREVRNKHLRVLSSQKINLISHTEKIQSEMKS